MSLLVGVLTVLSLQAARAEEPAPAGPPAAVAPPAVDGLAAAAAREAQAAVAVDPLASPERRRSAVRSLLAEGAPALPFLRALVTGPDPAMAGAVLDGLGALPSDAALPLARLAAAEALEPDLQLDAVRAVEALGRPEAGDALWAWAGAAQLSPAVRRAADAAVRRSYPGTLERQGAPPATTAPLAVLLSAGAGATTVGATLAGVGQLTDNDVATVVGGVGGAAIGGTMGTLWARQISLSVDGALALQTGTGWGLVIGALVGEGLGPTTWDPGADALRRHQRLTGLSRMVGTLGGVGVSSRRLDAPPSWQHSLATSAAGGFGLAAGFGLHQLRYPDCVPGDVVKDDLIVYSPCDDFVAWRTRGNLWGAAGAAAGLGAAWALEDRWTPDTAADPILWAVGAGALGRVGGELDGLRAPEPDGTGTQPATPVGLAVGFAAGALTAELLEPAPRQAALAGAGLGLGMLGGEGVERLVGLDERGAAAGWLGAGLGLGGAAAGLGLSQTTTWDAGDRTLVGVGSPVVWAWSGLWQASLSAQGLDVDGLALTSGAVLNTGLLGLSRAVEPEAGDVALLGAGAAWGATLGVMGPLAFGADGQAVLATSTVGGSQLVAAGMAAAVYSPLQLEARRTLKPQLGGLLGLTSGALVGALVQPSTQAVSIGGLIGAAAGLGGGVGWERARPTRDRGPQQAFAPRLGAHGAAPVGPRPSFVAAPTLIGDQVGVSVQAGLHGW
jgi:hypothetical protein